MSTARSIVAVVGVAALVGANYFLRHTLERGDVFIYSFLPYFYPAAEKLVFSPSYPWPKLFLPIRELGGAWTTTTLILTHFIEMRLTPPVTWYVFNAALMLVSFLTSWAAFRSLAFSFTFVICMGFGTQLYAAYAVTGAMSLCLLLIYYELVLLCAWRVVQGAAPAMVWRTAFALGVLVTALAYESWLDFAVFLWLAAVLTVAVGYRFGKREWWPGLMFAGGWLGLVCIAYLYIKIHFGYGQTAGAESDVVFNYPTLAPKVEDVLSNVLTQFYTAITNFLPPPFVSSTAFYSLGGDKIVELQHGYHAPYSYLVVMQYLFLWRYYAGAAFVVFSYVLIRTVRRSVEVWSPDTFAAAIFLLMVATGGPTHAFVKARPMNSMPVLGYHVLVGVLGIALLLSHFARLVMTGRRRRGVGAMVVAGMWALILFGALSRPAFLAHQAAQVGLGEGIYPSPWATLAAMFGGSTPPAAGAVLYRLTKYVPAASAAPEVSPGPAASPVPAANPAAAARSEAAAGPSPVTAFSPTPLSPPALTPLGVELEPLPLAAPDLTKWQVFPELTVTPGGRGYRVSGKSPIGSYQLLSPLMAVPPKHQLLLRVRGAIEQGRVCVGVLNESQQRWLLGPFGSQGEFTVDTGDSRGVWFVFVTCGHASGLSQSIRFEIESISYAVLMNPADKARP